MKMTLFLPELRRGENYLQCFVTKMFIKIVVKFLTSNG